MFSGSIPALVTPFRDGAFDEPAFRRLVKNEPTLLFYDGAFLDLALHRSRITRDEVLAAVRGEGIEGLADLRAVVLETDGTLSVVRARDGRPRDSSLAAVAPAGSPV